MHGLLLMIRDWTALGKGTEPPGEGASVSDQEAPFPVGTGSAVEKGRPVAWGAQARPQEASGTAHYLLPLGSPRETELESVHSKGQHGPEADLTRGQCVEGRNFSG